MPGREYLGEFEQIVLLALLRVGKDAYGVPVRREIEKQTGEAFRLERYTGRWIAWKARGWWPRGPATPRRSAAVERSAISVWSRSVCTL
ncbi:MAG TPA: hypothetical protein VHD76_00770 [Bryobacteraceae bacterium]|nr:hypothetical protein [Bryobacteraceae bacterium]